MSFDAADGVRDDNGPKVREVEDRRGVRRWWENKEE